MTGNPIFPYANNIFKSEYFSIDQSVNDIAAFPARFGPETFWQYIMWPIYCMTNKTRIVDQGAYSGRLLCACAGIALYFISKIWVKYSKEVKVCVGSVIIFYIEYLTVYQGYIRYMEILEIVASIISGVVLIVVFSQVKKQLAKILGMIVAMSFLIQVSVGLNDYCFANNEIALRPSIFTNLDGYLKNLKYVFKDRKTGVDNNILQSVDAWLATNYDSAYGAIIDGSKPIINIIPDCTITNETTVKIYNQHFESLKNKNVYAIANIYNIDTQINNMNIADFIVEDIQNITPYFQNAEYGMMLLKAEISTDKKSVPIYGWEEAVYTIPHYNKSSSIDVGIDASMRSDKESTYVIDVWVKNLNNEQDYILDTFEMDYYDKYKKIFFNIDEDEWNENTSIVITCKEKDGLPKAVRVIVTEPKEQ